MNKKLCLAAVLIMLSLSVLVACGNHSEKQEDLDAFLITEGVALTCEMDELAESKEYLEFVSASESFGQVTDKIASQDYSIPENVYRIDLSDDILKEAISALSGKTNIPDNIIEKLKYRINGSVIANMINANYGSEIVAATAMTAWGKSYIEPNGWSDNIILFLEYPGEFSSLVSFGQSGEGVISASAVFVKNSDRDILTLVDQYLGEADIEYSYYSQNQLQELLAE